MRTNRFLTIVFFFTCFATFGQSAVSNDKAAQLAKKHLTYLWTGRSTPHFVDTKKIYGFKIKGKGCLVTGHTIRHNRRVVNKINKVYGDNWFEENKKAFCQGIQ